MVCHSATFCVGGGRGKALTYDGSSWSAATKIGVEASSIACGSQSFCAVVDYAGKDAVTYEGGSWSAPVALGGRIDAVSCPPSIECVAVDDAGRSLAYDGESWSAPQVIDGVIPLASVSCPTDSFCMAVDQHGRALSRAAGVWSAPVEVDDESVPTSVSCASPSFCMAVDRAGNGFVYANGSWGAAVKFDRGEGGQGLPLSSVSCPSATYCVAVDEFGRTFTYASGSWSAANPADTWGLMSVSCHSASFCVAVDWQGRALEGGGGGWDAPAHVTEELSSVSCPTSTCVAVGIGQGWLAEVEHGYVSVLDGGAWSKAVSIDREGLNSVSCESDAFCIAVDGDGDVLTAGVPARRPLPPDPPVSPTAPAPSPPGGATKGSTGKTRIGHIELRGTTVSVRLACTGPSTASCRIALELLGPAASHEAGTKSRHPQPIVGRATISLHGGQEMTDPIKLNAAGRPLQTSHHQLTLTLVAEQTENGKPAVVSHRAIKLPAS